MEYHASATIDASPERVWAILTDSSRYPEWDSGVISIDGTIAPGERIAIVSEVNPKRAFRAEVEELAAAERMVWGAGMPLGLFRGERTFTLSRRTDGGTDFDMRERFSGPMLVLIKRSIPDLGPSFRQFAAGLKAEAETGS